jgi:hypothetical protein
MGEWMLYNSNMRHMVWIAGQAFVRAWHRCKHYKKQVEKSFTSWKQMRQKQHDVEKHDTSKQLPMLLVGHVRTRHTHARMQINNGTTLSEHMNNNNSNNNNNIRNNIHTLEPKTHMFNLQTPQSKFLSASFPPMRLNLPDECVYIDDEDDDNDEFASPAEPTIERIANLRSTTRGCFVSIMGFSCCTNIQARRRPARIV